MEGRKERKKEGGGREHGRREKEKGKRILKTFPSLFSPCVNNCL